MKYGSGITQARQERGFSKRHVAKLIGVDPSYITHIEADRKRPSLEVMENLAEALDRPLSSLIFECECNP